MKKGILVFSVIVLLVGVFQYNDATKDQTWEVLLKNYPTNLKPEMAVNIKGMYLIKQTHEPYFEKNDNGVYISNILSSWKRSSDSKSYSLCPKSNIQFSNGRAFDSDFVLEHLKNVSEKIWDLQTISIKSHCVSVIFNKTTRNFFAQLSKHQYAPSISANEKWDYGLGHYDVESHSTEKIVLKKKIKGNKYFNTIVAINSDVIEKEKYDQIEDYNFSRTGFPEEVKENYNSYSLKFLRSYNLILNIEDKVIREKVYNCLNIEKFRAIFDMKSVEYIDIQNIIPLGLKGSKAGKPSQACGKRKVNDGKSYVFINWKSQAQKPLEKFFADFQQKTGVKVVVEPLGDRGFGDLMFEKKHKYQLVVMAIETAYVLYEEFFELFTDPSMSVLDTPLVGLNADVRLLSDEQNEVAFNARLNRVLSEFESQRVYLPLFQPKVSAYFPDRVKSVNLDTQKLQYPKVGELRL